MNTQINTRVPNPSATVGGLWYRYENVRTSTGGTALELRRFVVAKVLPKDVLEIAPFPHSDENLAVAYAESLPAELGKTAKRLNLKAKKRYVERNPGEAMAAFLERKRVQLALLAQQQVRAKQAMFQAQRVDDPDARAMANKPASWRTGVLSAQHKAQPSAAVAAVA